MKILLLGGSKSGKSMLAQELCRKISGGKKMIYWATMDPVDDEDLRHIEIHRQERAGWGFDTVECARNLSLREIQGESTVLFDSVTALLTNEMFGKKMDESAPEKTLLELTELSERCANIVCVCDEIWRDGITYEDWTQRFVKGLALTARGLAASFDTVIEVVAGVPHYLKGDPI